MISCALPNQQKNTETTLQKGKIIDFEEINHVNLKLINTEYRILNSQEEINLIYKNINNNNPSPRKNPIPSFSEDETYIVLQPKIEKTDFVIKEILEGNDKLEINIDIYDNPEFINKKYPISIIKLNKKTQYNNIVIKK
ncbi:hypothetical protein GCM10007332_12650 [Epilithonimonas arachidiradicis]|nr:hypothetical protein GCM10007332_12650 [Epilithonimonas arachidiradicis]